MPINRPQQPKALEGSSHTNSICNFVVVIRHEEYASRLWVAGIEDARCVLDGLSRSFVFKTSEPLEEVERSTRFSFRVTHGSQLSQRKLESLLVAIPGVKLRIERSLGEEMQL